MNLQRFVSTVYSERIKPEYFTKLAPYLNTLFLNLDFETIRKSYTELYKPYKTNQPTVDYILHNLMFEKIFGNTIGNIYKTHTNTLVIFPIFQDVESKNRLQDELKSIYSPILSNRDTQEFTRKDSNSYMFIPIFSDESETNEEYTERLTTYLNRWFVFIQEQKPLPTNVRPRKYSKFETICYTVNHENGLFTDYYKSKLKPDKEKIVNKLLTTFIEKLGMNNGSSVKDPILQLTPEITTKKFKADGQTDAIKLSQFIDLLKAFIDIYKRTNDKVYLKSASASDNQTMFRIYYRVNNTDYLDDFTEIKPGSSNVYKIKDKEGTRIGYFIEKKSIKTQYLFREYTGLSKQLEKNEKEVIMDKIDKITKPSDEEGKEYIIETQLRGNVIYFKRLKKGDYSEKYEGIVEPYMNLHIYERYKWFDFRDISGDLASETKIKFYENILFDKKSLIEFLISKKEYSKDTKLNKEFLKINQSNTLLLEYAEYIMMYMKKSNVFKETYFGNRLETFIEKTKKSILDIIFQTNSILYMTKSHSSDEKTNIKNNYKMVTYNYYEPTKEHFERVIYDTKESKYCSREKKCEIIKEMESNQDIVYNIVIVDVTKDTIEVDEKLKKKTYCKKIRKTLKKQLQPYLREFLPRWTGGSITRRRKYRH